MVRGEKATQTGERTAFILFTDIYRSSYLWEEYPEEFKQLLHRHNVITEEAANRNHCETLKNLGDGYLAAFEEPEQALECAVSVQRELADFSPLPDGSRVLLRVALHAGTPHRLPQAKEYFGPTLNRCSRICQVCHPGQVLVSDPVKKPLGEPPAGAELTDLGELRLRDLAEPEHLYQLDHPDFALHEFPPLPTLGYRPNNLVVQPNAFIGRERESDELKALVLERKQRLITITAPGGYGKSRLATQLCANLLDYYENGVFEVLLAPVGDASRLVSVTADALGFQFYGKADPQQQLIDYLREKNMLICFDNFEHVMEGKDLLTELLQHAAKVSMLVTSREPLCLKAEKVYRLKPLPVERDDTAKRVGPRHAVPLQEEGESLPEAVQLFVDRASLVKHDFALTEENLTLVNDICAKLEGVPLSLELAAAWVDSFTLGELLSEVEQQLEITAKMTDVPKRQRSIRASLDWSYNLLTDEQRGVVRAVSTFKGGFFFEAAEAVGAQHVVPSITGNGARARHAVPLRTVLSQLCDKGWLFTREALGKTRFFIRDAATHQYAFEKLKESEDHEPSVLAHSRYFAELIEREGERLEGHGQLEALKILGAELENIYEALDTALNRADVELLLPFAKHLVSYLDMVSRWQEGLAWYERIARVPDENEASVEALLPLRIYSHLGLGQLYRRLSRHEEAEEGASAARKLAEEAGDRKSVATSLHILGNVARVQGRYEEAEKLWQESLQIEREIGNRSGIALSLSNLGIVAHDQGRYEEAEKLHNESLQIQREIGNRWGIAASVHNVGMIAASQARFEKAEELFREALAINRAIGNRAWEAYNLQGLGWVTTERGRYNEAQELYQESLQIQREIGDRYGIANSLNNLGRVASDQGRYEQAEKLYHESLQIERQIGDRYGIANSLNNLGNVARVQGRYEEAEKLYHESLQIKREIGDRSGIANSLNALGVVTCDQGRYEEAQKLHKESLKIERGIGNRWGVAASLNNLGALSIKQERFSDACEFLTEALEVSSEIGDRDINRDGLITCGYLLVMTGRLKESALLFLGAERDAKEMNYKLQPMEQGMMDEGMAKLKDAASEEELAEAKSKAEKMALEELADFALKALEGLEL